MPRRRSSRHSVELAFALALALTLAGALASYRFGAEAGTWDRWIDRTLEAMVKIQECRTVAAGMEAAQRTFLLSGDAREMAAYEKQVALLDPALERLSQSTEDSPAQQRRVAQLREILEKRLRLAHETLRVYQSGDAAGVQERIASRRGIRLAEEVQNTLDGMSAEERRLLSERAQNWRRSSFRFTTALVATFVFAALAMLAALIAMRRDIARREQAEGKLKDAQKQLEQRVSERTTDLAQAMEALRKRELELHTLVEACPEIVWIADSSGAVVYLNSRWRHYTGHAEPRALAGGWQEIVHPDDIGMCKARWQHSVASADPYECELRFRRRDGSYRWFLGRAEPVRDAGGQVERWFGAFTEIEEQKRASKALSEIQEQLEIQVDQRTSELRREIEQRHLAEREIQNSLREKEALLNEVHHRVKNNLQVISSLLHMQSEMAPDPVSRQMFDESQNRVLSMALIHESLYRASDFSSIAFDQYIARVLDSLIASYGASGRNIRCRLDAPEPVLMTVEKAIPCGLIVNELVCNSLKHAFPGSGGQVVVEIRRQQERVRICVADNGIGLPPGFVLSEQKSLGLQIVNALLGQLRGSLHLDGGAGTRIEFTFLPGPNVPGPMKSSGDALGAVTM